MELGVHLPLVRLGDEQLSLTRLARVVDSARELGFAALSANDHLVFRAPWLDGPTALASMVERSGALALATTVALPVVRGPVPLAKALAALDILSEGRLVVGVGPGSSKGDYDVAGVPFEERWKRFDEALAVMRALLNGEALPDDLRHYALPAGVELSPAPGRKIPVWVASWGSDAGLARVARAGDGWLASAYNTTPERFAAGRAPAAGRRSRRAGDDVDLGHGRPRGGRADADRCPGTVPEPGSRRAPRPGLRRLRRALRRAPLALRGSRLRARLPVAVG